MTVAPTAGTTDALALGTAVDTTETAALDQVNIVSRDRWNFAIKNCNVGVDCVLEMRAAELTGTGVPAVAIALVACSVDAASRL